jgi:transcriptional regulator with XRE-family HTH domain
MAEIGINYEKLRQVARDERWTDNAIARNTGLSQGGVSKILNGQVIPSAPSLKKICDTIGLPIHEVFVEKKAA